MNIFTSVWKLLTDPEPKAGEKYVFCDELGNPWSILVYEVIEVRNGWVKLKRYYNGSPSGEESKKISTLKLFYYKK